MVSVLLENPSPKRNSLDIFHLLSHIFLIVLLWNNSTIWLFIYLFSRIYWFYFHSTYYLDHLTFCSNIFDWEYSSSIWNLWIGLARKMMKKNLTVIWFGGKQLEMVVFGFLYLLIHYQVSIIPVWISSSFFN